MHEINLAYEVEHTIAAPLAEVFAFFSDMNNFRTCTTDVVDFEVLNKQTSKWRLETKKDLGMRFTPEYTLRYDYEPENTVSWRSIDGNVQIDATLKLSLIDNCTTHVIVREEVSFTLPVSAIMAKIVKTVATIETRKDMLDVLKMAGNQLATNIQDDSVSNNIGGVNATL